MAIEIYDGTNWTKLVNSTDLQSVIILPVIATDTNNIKSIRKTIDGVDIPPSGIFLVTEQEDINKNGVYTMNIDHSITRISPQPLGVYVVSGKYNANTLYFNIANIWKRLEMNTQSTKNKRKK